MLHILIPLLAERRGSFQDLSTSFSVIIFQLHASASLQGLFRIAGSSSRVKFLKAAFDAQLPMISSNGSEQYQVVSLLTNDMDHHAISSLLKTYLRELPDALPTSALYDEWMDTTRY